MAPFAEEVMTCPVYPFPVFSYQATVSSYNDARIISKSPSPSTSVTCTPQTPSAKDETIFSVKAGIAKRFTEKRLIKNKIVKILCERFLTIWKPLQEKYAQQLNYCIHREHYFQMR